jgi:hypothetical protein
MNHGFHEFAAAVFSVLCLTQGHAAPNTNQFTLVTKEVSLGKIPLAARLDQGVRSPDSRQMACPVVRGGRWTVSRNGVEGPQYYKVDDLAFSSNGERIAHAALRHGKAVVVVDGTEDRNTQA